MSRGAPALACLCLLLAAMLPARHCRPSWRPQGRFGKRLAPTRPESVAEPMLSVSDLLDVPVELLFTKEELESAAAKPQLCSLSGVLGYPTCNLHISSGVPQTDRDLLRSLLTSR